ncbi:MAG: DUF3391 domain-containing protein [Pseudomonadales bacterium]|nr:DUF3391 domain-containing protein [Pseudomonadales bacterium]
MQLPSSASSGYLITLDTHDLLIGMFVCELDCPWSVTPFPMGGFHVKKVEDIEVLQKFCKVVTIDTNKGAEPARRRKTDLTILSSARKAAPPASAVKVNRDTYPSTHSTKQLLDKSVRAYEQLQDQFQLVCDSIRDGQCVDLQSLHLNSNALIESLLANPQALIWILFTDGAPRHTFSYCVRAAIWAAILGRQVGLKRNDIDTLFMGTLLCDIGMNLLPERLVTKRGLFRKKEYLAYRKHVDLGVDLLSQYADPDEQVIRIVRCHHERHDGLGFPRGVKGDQIPSLARYATLAFCFERLLRSNLEHGQISPARAIARLYKQRVLKFPEQLVVEFIHVMGMYPTGTLVKLCSGELALVLEQNDTQRLFPKIALLSNAKRKLLSKPKVIDLAAESSDANRGISCSIDPGKYPLQLSQYRMEFFGTKIGVGSLSIRL